MAGCKGSHRRQKILKGDSQNCVLFYLGAGKDRPAEEVIAFGIIMAIFAITKF
jgi:hypothetical protein